MPRLTDKAIRLLKETAEAEREAGDPEVATALELLLQWHDEQQEEGIAQ